MDWIKLFEEFKRRKERLPEVHNLSGIALVVEDKILLVHPRKHKRISDKWSVPKGHVEGENSLKSALKELEEESGIKLEGEYDDMFKIDYKKSGAYKFMDVYVYYLTKKDISKYLGEGWEIKKKWFDKKEIWRCKFFDLERASEKIEIEMLDIISEIAKRKSIQ
jgi:8-oxo-dGTP pyrophosphatase MutT (NUDIX family)